MYHQQQQSTSSSHSHNQSHHLHEPKLEYDRCGLRHRWHACPELHKAMDGVNYIADHTRKEEESTKVIPFYLTSTIFLRFSSYSSYLNCNLFADFEKISYFPECQFLFNIFNSFNGITYQKIFQLLI